MSKWLVVVAVSVVWMWLLPPNEWMDNTGMISSSLNQWREHTRFTTFYCAGYHSGVQVAYWHQTGPLSSPPLCIREETEDREAECPGSRAPVLLLHGFPTSSFDFQSIWNDLAQVHSRLSLLCWRHAGPCSHPLLHCRVISFDFVGYGFSDKPIDFPYSVHILVSGLVSKAHNLTR